LLDRRRTGHIAIAGFAGRNRRLQLLVSQGSLKLSHITKKMEPSKLVFQTSSQLGEPNELFLVGLGVK
jgi:hypothetical protein